MRDTKAPCRFTDDLEHYLVVFKEDDIKKIVGAEELRKCDERVKGASCEALWKDSNHTDWYPAFIVDIGDLEYLKSVQLGRQKLQKVQKKKLPAASSTNKKAAVSAKKRKKPAVQKIQDVESECEDEQKRRKTLNNDAKAKKAANAKALKEALLKRRLEQAKVFDIPPNDNYDSDIECTSSNNMHANQEKEYLSTVRQVITYTGSKDKRKPKKSAQQPLSESESESQSLSDIECVDDVGDFEHFTSTPSRKQVPHSFDTFCKSKEKEKKGIHSTERIQTENSCGCQESILLREENAKLKRQVKDLQLKISEQSVIQETDEKPLAGVISSVLAGKHKMEEVVTGSMVYWYPSQRLNALAEGKTIGSMTSYLLDVFFSKETMSVSNLNGGGYCGYKQLCPKTVHAITAFVQSQFKDSKVALVRKTIQDKCTGCRRGISKRKEEC